MSQSRQLAAIMFTDIVGYTALMEKDEAAAFGLLKKNRQLQKPIIERYNGRWLKEIGDGVLASFNTITDAVYSAGEIQEACDKDPDHKLRIGIHQGEVVFEGDDVFGSGVNIASRLEPLATPGGILVSEVIHKNLVNKKDFQSTFIGEMELKGVKEAMKVYKVEVLSSQAINDYPDTNIARSKTYIKKGILGQVMIGVAILILLLGYLFFSKDLTPQKPEKAKIAVLPFINDSSEGENQYFCNGMTDEIRNHIEKIEGLIVLSRTAVEPYRNQNPGFETIAQELDVDYILEGAGQKRGDQFRLTVQLIDVLNGDHLWSNSYDGTFTDTIFTIQTSIAKKVAKELSATIAPEELERIDLIPTKNMAAYDYYLQGNAQIDMNLPDNNLVAMSYFKRAIEEDSMFSRAYGGLARTMAHQHLRFGQEYSWLADSALQMLNKALTYDPDNNVFLTMKCFMLIQLGWYDETKKVQESLRQVVGVESGQYINVKFIEHQFKGNIDSMMYWSLKWQELTEEEYDPIWTIAVTYMWLGEFSKSMTLSKDLKASGFEMLQVPIFRALKEQDLATAKRHSEAMIPVHPYWGFLKTGEIAIRMGDHSDAISKLEEALEKHPTLPFPGYFNRSIHTVLSFAYLQIGENSKAHDLLQEVRKSNLYQVEIGEQSMKYRFDLASGYAVEGNAKQAIYWLEEARKQGLNQYWLLEDDPIFDKISNHVGYQRVTAEMKSYIERMRIRVRELKEQMSVDR